MRSKIHVGLISAVSLVFLFSGMVFARSKQINVIYKTTVGKSLKLMPGKYRIDVPKNAKEAEVQFYNQDGDLVGKVPAKVVSTSQKNSQTEIDYSKLASNRERMTEIVPSGWREDLVFHHSSAQPKSVKQ